MAAILCNGCCSIMNECCNGCSKVCDCCGDVCVSCGEFICHPDRPLPIYPIFSGVFCLPAIGAVIYYLASVEWSFGCGNVVYYLLGQSLLFLIHFIFSFYAYIRFTKMMEDKSEGALSSFAAGSKFFLYDCGMCIYIVILIAAVVFNIVGIVWIQESPDCPKTLGIVGLFLNIASWVYMFLLVCVGFCSMCCECCRDCCEPQRAKFNRGTFGTNKVVYVNNNNYQSTAAAPPPVDVYNPQNTSQYGKPPLPPRNY
eukprot:TRINITY_DN2636_c1_g1_i1.p1 TRINITY_DN2636_c1_g1~~TRINITY_DN2636_c1_g1_i1.p1  ORF type:complete len:271 (+),score=37.38 TRINITY_DN2636_c1_g1_i1:50-814(+)